MTNTIDPFTSAERLRKLADIVEAHPERFDMDYWAKDGGVRVYSISDVVRWDLLDVEDCGEVCCLGGWSVTLWGSELTSDCVSWVVAGAHLLGLSYAQADDLFTAGQNNEEMPERLRRWAYCIEEGIDPLEWDKAHRLDATSRIIDGDLEQGVGLGE